MTRSLEVNLDFFLNFPENANENLKNADTFKSVPRAFLPEMKTFSQWLGSFLIFCFSFSCYWGKKFNAYSFNIFFDHYFIKALVQDPTHTCLNKMLSLSSKNSSSSGRHRQLNQHVDISVWQMPLAGCRRCYGNIAVEVRKVSRRGNIRLWCLDSSLFLSMCLKEFSA